MRLFAAALRSVACEYYWGFGPNKEWPMSPSHRTTACIDTSDDPKLLHAEVECRAIQSQTRCCTPGAGKNPLGFLQCRQDVLTLDVLQSLAVISAIPKCDSTAKVLRSCEDVGAYS